MRHLQPKTGLLPKHIPTEDWVTISDVHEGYFYIWKGMKGVLFCDVDGTVADLTHRRKFVATKPKNWPAFERGISNDLPIQTVIDAVNALYDCGWTVIMCTGRGAQSEMATIDWLNKFGVKFHHIYTRAFNDYRRDDIIKEELLTKIREDGFDPDVVFDDRNQVVDMWRKNNIPCVQVAEGDF